MSDNRLSQHPRWVEEDDDYGQSRQPPRRHHYPEPYEPRNVQGRPHSAGAVHPSRNYRQTTNNAAPLRRLRQAESMQEMPIHHFNNYDYSPGGHGETHNNNADDEDDETPSEAYLNQQVGGGGNSLQPPERRSRSILEGQAYQGKVVDTDGLYVSKEVDGEEKKMTKTDDRSVVEGGSKKCRNILVLVSVFVVMGAIGIGVGLWWATSGASKKVTTVILSVPSSIPSISPSLLPTSSLVPSVVPSISMVPSTSPSISNMPSYHPVVLSDTFSATLHFVTTRMSGATTQDLQDATQDLLARVLGELDQPIHNVTVLVTGQRIEDVSGVNKPLTVDFDISGQFMPMEGQALQASDINLSELSRALLRSWAIEYIATLKEGSSGYFNFLVNVSPVEEQGDSGNITLPPRIPSPQPTPSPSQPSARPLPDVPFTPSPTKSPTSSEVSALKKSDSMRNKFLIGIVVASSVLLLAPLSVWFIRRHRRDSSVKDILPKIGPAMDIQHDQQEDEQQPEQQQHHDYRHHQLIHRSRKTLISQGASSKFDIDDFLSDGDDTSDGGASFAYSLNSNQVNMGDSSENVVGVPVTGVEPVY